MTRRIYLDNHATTPVDPKVLDAMLPYFREQFGNAASGQHSFGWEAQEAVDRARAQVAQLLNAQPRDIVFCSGATEANNLALKGLYATHGEQRNHIITSNIEHPAVLDVVQKLERQGAQVTRLAVDSNGLIRMDDLKKAIRDTTLVISIMSANNEIGTLQPVEAIGRLAREHNVFFHTDAAQAAGKIALDVEALNIDLLSISAHKLYGPKGVGALYVRRRAPRVTLESQIDGGGHERGMRSGTLAVPLLVGLGEACALASHKLEDEAKRLLDLRRRLWNRLSSALDGVTLNGDPERRLPGNLNLSFAFVEGQSLLMGLRDIAVSSSSACQSQNAEPSHVLQALGISDDLAHTSLRFGIGRFNTEQEIDIVAERVIATVTKLRKLSPLYEPDTASGQTSEPTA